MKYINSAIILLLICNMVAAQDAISITRFGNTSVITQDSFIMISMFGEPFGGIHFQDDYIVSSLPLPFLWIGNETTAIHDLPLIDGLSLYPNPTSDITFLKRIDGNDKFRVRLISAKGIILMEKNWEYGNNVMPFSLEDFLPGIYFISVTDENTTRASLFKVVKR